MIHFWLTFETLTVWHNDRKSLIRGKMHACAQISTALLFYDTRTCSNAKQTIRYDTIKRMKKVRVDRRKHRKLVYGWKLKVKLKFKRWIGDEEKIEFSHARKQYSCVLECVELHCFWRWMKYVKGVRMLEQIINQSNTVQMYQQWTPHFTRIKNECFAWIFSTKRKIFNSKRKIFNSFKHQTTFDRVNTHVFCKVAQKKLLWFQSKTETQNSFEILQPEKL